jgi:aryl-alcohol dehydrogenase-like predicted oxidoreductase
MSTEIHTCVNLLWTGKHRTVISLLQALRDVPRNAYYIATKVARYETDPRKMFDFSREKTLKSVDHSLKLLGLDYVDIIQVCQHSHSTELQKSLKVYFVVAFIHYRTLACT